jgi:hypothetical protein
MNNFNNNPLEVFPIPDEAIILDDQLIISPKKMVILAMKKLIEENNLDLNIGPELDLYNPLRSIILNKFDIQIVTTGLISDEIIVSIKNAKKVGKGPQLILAAQIEEDSNIVFFKGVLTSSEFLKIIDNKQLNNDEIEVSIDSFKGGIERLFRFVRLLDSNAINRLSINSKSNLIIWEKIRRKIKIGGAILMGSVSSLLLGPELFRPKLIVSIAKLTPQLLAVSSYSRSSSSDIENLCLLTPTVIEEENNLLKAVIKIDKPIIYSLTPLSEIIISKGNKTVWRDIGSSERKIITGPINWPIKPIQKGDKYNLSLRPKGFSKGSEINISLYADSKEELLKIDQLTKKLGDSKKGWVKEIKKSLKTDKDLGLTLLFSEKAAVSKELMDARLELTKDDKCL